jgi:hypothetical protein
LRCSLAGKFKVHRQVDAEDLSKLAGQPEVQALAATIVIPTVHPMLLTARQRNLAGAAVTLPPLSFPAIMSTTRSTIRVAAATSAASGRRRM